MRSLREEAAAEIERLRIELASVRKLEVWIDAHVADFAAEIERLRIELAKGRFTGCQCFQILRQRRPKTESP